MPVPAADGHGTGTRRRRTVTGWQPFSLATAWRDRLVQAQNPAFEGRAGRVWWVPEDVLALGQQVAEAEGSGEHVELVF
jgi:hypothetical protein